MNLFRQPPAQNFSEWLDLATHDLVPSAQARIRTEIEAHYTEAVQLRLANGLSESIARATALADLGSPKSAARRFRKEYLTKANAWYVAFSDGGGGFSFAFSLMSLQATLFMLENGTVNVNSLSVRIYAVVELLLFLLIVVTSIAIYLLRKRKLTLRTRRKIILVNSIQWLAAGPILLLQNIICPLGSNPPAINFLRICLPFASVALLAIAVSASLRLLRLHKKLLTASENDIPPLKTRF